MAGARPKSPKLEGRFVAHSKYGFGKDAVREEIRSLLNSRGIPHKIEINGRRKNHFLSISVDEDHESVAHEALERAVTGSIRRVTGGVKRKINRKMLVIPPRKLVVPRFDDGGRIRELYTPSTSRGATGARAATLMVNMSEAPRNGKILIPTLGYGIEAIAAALAGHNVIAGDIGKLALIGKTTIGWYSGGHHQLERSLEEKLERNLSIVNELELPLERLKNIHIAQWDANRLPISNDANFDSSIFDPPFGMITKARGPGGVRIDPLEATLSFLKESARVVKPNGTVVIRVPSEWVKRIREAQLPLNLEYVFSLPKTRRHELHILKFRKPKG